MLISLVITEGIKLIYFKRVELNWKHLKWWYEIRK